MQPFGQNVQLFDWANRPATSTTDQAPITNRPGTALYVNSAGVANQGGVLSLGSDYGSTPKAQVPKVDASGNIYVTGANTATAGMAVATPTGPICFGLASGVARALQIDALQNLVVAQDVLPTFVATAAGVAVTTGKSVFALVNGSTAGTVLRLAAVYVVNSSTTTSALGNTYNIYASELRPITGVSAAGTNVAILAHDSSDSLDAGVKAYTGSTVTGDTQGPYRRWISSNYGLTTNASNSEAISSEEQGKQPWVKELGGMSKPIVVRPGAGVHVKIASTATMGYLDVTCVFTAASA